MTSEIIESLSGLPADAESGELDDLLARPIKSLSLYRILELRCAIIATLDREAPIVSAALNLLDGQIALREIAAGAPWR